MHSPDSNDRVPAPAPCGRRSGFTLVEVLAVIAIAAVVMGLLMPALAASKRHAQGIACLNHLRQLGLAWTMYSEDFAEWLPGVTGGSEHERGKWVSGWLDFSQSPDNTNSLLLTSSAYSQLGSYLQTAAVYKCPSDRSVVEIRGRSQARVRSVSMNCWMNYTGSAQIGQDRFRVFRKQSDLTDPSPDQAMVFLDERADSINDGMFQTNLKDRRHKSKLVDYPASAHNGGAGIWFADGHAQTKRWLDQRTIPAIRTGRLIQLDVPSPDNPDVAWLQEHASSALVRETP